MFVKNSIPDNCFRYTSKEGASLSVKRRMFLSGIIGLIVVTNSFDHHRVWCCVIGIKFFIINANKNKLL